MAQIDSGTGDSYTYRQPSLTYRFSETNIDGKSDGQEAVRQAIRHMIMSERYESAIYDDGYGIELGQYIGQGIGFLVAGIEDTLRDALLQDDRITGVTVTDVSDLGGGEASVSFSVDTIYGSIDGQFNTGV